MRILVIGNNRSTRAFSDLLSENEKNIVFTSLKNCKANFVDIGMPDVYEWKEFALANDINLTILCDFEAIDGNFPAVFNEAGLSVFAPDKDALRVCSSKSFAKKFMYRNKIKTPQFQIFDKLALAIDYVRAANFPVVIKPDEHSNMLGTTVCETFGAASKVLNNFFTTGIRNVVIENFVPGREFSAYFITDGFRAFLLDFVANENNRFASLGADFLDNTVLNRVQEIAGQTIEALAKTDNNYVGILGIDFILGDDGVLYALEYNPFFDDLDVELFTCGVDENWEKLFESAILGTLRDEFPEIKKHSGHFVTEIDEALNFYSAQGRTLNEAKENLLEEKIEDAKIALTWEDAAWKF